MKIRQTVERLVKYRLYIVVLFVVILGAILLFNSGFWTSNTGEETETTESTETEPARKTEVNTEQTETVSDAQYANPDVLSLYAEYRSIHPERNYFTPATEKIDDVEYTVYSNGVIEVRNSTEKEITFSKDGIAVNTIKIDYINEEMPYLEVYGFDLTGDGVEEIICHWEAKGSYLGGERLLVINPDTMEEISYIERSSSGAPSLSEEVHNWFNGVYVYLRYEAVDRRSFNCDIMDGRLAVYRVTDDDKYMAGCYMDYNNGSFIKGEEFVKCLEDDTYTDVKVPEGLSWELDFKYLYYGYNTFEEYDFYVYERVIDGAPMYCYEHRDAAEDITFLVSKNQMRGTLIHAGKQVSFDIMGILTGTSSGGAIEYMDVTGDGRKDFIYHEYGGTGAGGETHYVIYDVESMVEYKIDLECQDIIDSISIQPMAVVGSEEEDFYIEYELNVSGELYNTYRWIGGTDNAVRMDMFNQAKEDCGVYNTAYAYFYEDYASAAIYVSDRGTKLGCIYIDIVFDEENNTFILDKNSMKVHVNDYPQTHAYIQSKAYYTMTTETIDETEYIIYTKDNITVKSNNRNNNFEFTNGEIITSIKVDYLDKNNPVLDVYGYDLTGDGVDEIVCHWIPSQTVQLGERMLILDAQSLEKIDYISYSAEDRPELSEEEHSWMNAVLLHLGYPTVHDKIFSCDVIDGKLAIYRITEDERYMTGYYLVYENGAFIKSERFTKMALDNGYYTDIEVPDNLSWQLWDRDHYYHYNEYGFYNDFKVSEILIDGEPVIRFYSEKDDIAFLVNEKQDEGTLIYNGKQVSFPIVTMLTGTSDGGYIEYTDVTGDGRKEFIYHYSGGSGSFGYTQYKIFDMETLEEYVIDSGENVAERISFRATGVGGNKTDGYYMNYEAALGDATIMMSGMLYNGITDESDVDLENYGNSVTMSGPYVGLSSKGGDLYTRFVFTRGGSFIGAVYFDLVFDEGLKAFVIDESSIR